MGKEEKKAQRKSENLKEILSNKTIKAKGKTSQISQLLLDDKVSIQELINFAKSQMGTNKATLIEAMEYASKIQPSIIGEKGFEFVTQSLALDAPRVKWESAKVVGNTAHLFPKLLKKAVINLLNNTEDKGTVVRWSAAHALSQIINCKTSLNKGLIPAIETIIKREEDNAIIKIYQKALKKAT